MVIRVFPELRAVAHVRYTQCVLVVVCDVWRLEGLVDVLGLAGLLVKAGLLVELVGAGFLVKAGLLGGAC